MYLKEILQSEKVQIRNVLEKIKNAKDIKTVKECGKSWEKNTQTPSSFNSLKEFFISVKYLKFFFYKERSFWNIFPKETVGEMQISIKCRQFASKCSTLIQQTLLFTSDHKSDFLSLQKREKMNS